MNTIKEIKLRNMIVESEGSKTYYTDSACIEDSGILHISSFDHGPKVESSWGHDYEYDIYVAKEWKDTILLLLLQERFKTATEFKNWCDAHNISSTASLW